MQCHDLTRRALGAIALTALLSVSARAELPSGQQAVVRQVEAYFNGIQQILLGDATPQEAMDEAADEIQALLN